MPMPGALHQVCKFFGIKQAGLSKPAGVRPMGITDKKRFAELDALIMAGFGNTPQDKIPDEAIIAVEDGQEIPIKGPDRDIRFAREIGEPLERFTRRKKEPTNARMSI
jgi:hypothetical protein